MARQWITRAAPLRFATARTSARIGATQLIDDAGQLTPAGQALVDRQKADGRLADLEIGAVLVGGILLGAWVGATYFPLPATGPFGIPALVHGRVGGALVGGFFGFVTALVGGFWAAMTFGGAEM